MDEARRFLRYVVPGLVYGAQSIALLFIVVPWWTGPTLKDLSDDRGLGAAIALLLASGGLGFLFSTFHHALHWIPSLSAVDHRPLIEFLKAKGWIQVTPIAESPASGVREDIAQSSNARSDAWVLVTSLWYTRTKVSKRMEGADPRSVSLSDAMHSVGTARVAALAASLTAFAIMATVSTIDIQRWPSFVAGMALAVGVPIVLHWSYRRTGNLAQRFVSSVLADYFAASGKDPEVSVPAVAHLEPESVPSKTLASNAPPTTGPESPPHRVPSQASRPAV